MNIFYGAYGFDILSIFLILLSTLLNFSHYTSIIGSLLIIIVIFRAFSKNISKRTSELNKFTSIVNNILGKFGKSLPYNLPRIKMDNIPMLFNQIKFKFNQSRKFKIVKCPNCGQKLRLPRIKKKVLVTCKRCSFEFHTKA